MLRKPIGNLEEHDSSLASNVPERRIDHRGGSPGEIAGRNSQCKEIRIQLNVISPAHPVLARFSHSRQISKTYMSYQSVTPKKRYQSHATPTKCWVVALLDKKGAKTTNVGDCFPKSICERGAAKGNKEEKLQVRSFHNRCKGTQHKFWRFLKNLGDNIQNP